VIYKQLQEKYIVVVVSRRTLQAQNTRTSTARQKGKSRHEKSSSDREIGYEEFSVCNEVRTIYL
jgi:hypothetical protein